MNEFENKPFTDARSYFIWLAKKRRSLQHQYYVNNVFIDEIKSVLTNDTRLLLKATHRKDIIENRLEIVREQLQSLDHRNTDAILKADYRSLNF